MAKEIRDLHESDEDDDEYDENADEDFNPDTGAAEEDNSSSDDEPEDDGNSSRPRGKKTAKRKSEAVEELDSGDEATIKERKKKRRKQNEEADDASSADEQGFIRTRAQRQAEKVELKERRKATLGHVSIDVDQLWAEMSSLPIGRPSIAPPVGSRTEKEGHDAGHGQNGNAPLAVADDMITIKKRITYAGEITEVEEQVSRSSKEAQRYLAEHPEADPNHARHNVDPRGLQRPLKRPSIFEPNPMSLVKGVAAEKLRPRAPSRIDVKRMEEEQKKKAQKMSTVQKSALDWKGFVDREGLRDELDEYGKSKKGFMAREAFLDRAAGARESAAREARLKL